ncbi:MAG: hypothetical protein H0W20_10765 [Chthoniobacterales bacterium]|nr:hypothetical protein [Chthoniobacterales bacterium]
MANAQNAPAAKSTHKRAPIVKAAKRKKKPQQSQGADELRPIPLHSPHRAEAFGIYRSKVQMEVLQAQLGEGVPHPQIDFRQRQFLAPNPLRRGQQPILVIEVEEDRRFLHTGMIRIVEPDDYELLEDAGRQFNVARIKATFKSAAKMNRHVLSAGSDAYATLKYLCAGGKLKGRLPDFDRIDRQILERWPEWQRSNAVSAF